MRRSVLTLLFLLGGAPRAALRNSEVASAAEPREQASGSKPQSSPPLRAAPSALTEVAATAFSAVPSQESGQEPGFWSVLRHRVEAWLGGGAGPAAGGKTQIPRQLVLTGKVATVQELPRSAYQNLKRTLDANPGIKLRYLSDDDCHKYLEEHFEPELLQDFEKQSEGKFRGDICRLAVLLREGGFYMDLDVQPHVSLEALAEDATFVAAFEAPRDGAATGAVLNAFMAAVPESAVLKETKKFIRRWVELGETQTDEWLGPWTLGRGLAAVINTHCPEQLKSAGGGGLGAHWTCGHDTVKMLFEDKIRCEPRSPENQAECPESRATSHFSGNQYGIFEFPRSVVAWSRFEECQSWGCGADGVDARANEIP